jgi:hypothetical protein
VPEPEQEPTPFAPSLLPQLPRLVSIAAAVWVVTGVVLFFEYVTGSGPDKFTFTVDSIAFRVWIAGLGVMAIYALSAIARRERPAEAPRPTVERGVLELVFALAALAWIVAGIAQTQNMFNPAGWIGFLDAMGFRVASASLALIAIRRTRHLEPGSGMAEGPSSD